MINLSDVLMIVASLLVFVVGAVLFIQWARTAKAVDESEDLEKRRKNGPGARYIRQGGGRKYVGRRRGKA